MNTQTKHSLMRCSAPLSGARRSWPRAQAPAWELIPFWPGAAGWRCWCCCPRSAPLMLSTAGTAQPMAGPKPLPTADICDGGASLRHPAVCGLRCQQIGITLNPSTAKAGFRPP